MRKTLFLVIFGSVACGTPAQTVDEVDQFVEGLAFQQCSWLYKCCTDPEIKSQEGVKFNTQVECVPYKQLALVNQLYVERLGVREGRLRVDPDQAKACLAQ